MLFLDKRNQLISDELQQVGTVDHTPVYPREVIKRALELSATAIILVHNHPSGDPTPSQADIQMTRGIVDIADPARHRRARPHHRRQERACELEGAEADLRTCRIDLAARADAVGSGTRCGSYCSRGTMQTISGRGQYSSIQADDGRRFKVQLISFETSMTYTGQARGYRKSRPYIKSIRSGYAVPGDLDGEGRGRASGRLQGVQDHHQLRRSRSARRSS